MTPEREELKTLLLSIALEQKPYVKRYPLGQLEKQLYSWHQQSLERAVENYKQSVLEKLDDGTFMKNFMKELLTPPQLEVKKEK